MFGNYGFGNFGNWKDLFNVEYSYSSGLDIKSIINLLNALIKLGGQEFIDKVLGETQDNETQLIKDWLLEYRIYTVEDLVMFTNHSDYWMDNINKRDSLVEELGAEELGLDLYAIDNTKKVDYEKIVELASLFSDYRISFEENNETESFIIVGIHVE